MADFFGTDDNSASTWGGLLGGPRDELVSPIVGNAALADARRNALLNAGIGLMSASGPQPFRHSFGQDLAKGLAAGQQAYSGALDTSLKSAMTAQQLRMAQFNMARQQALLHLASGLIGGGDGSFQPSGASMTGAGGTPPMPSAGGGAGSMSPSAAMAMPPTGQNAGYAAASPAAQAASQIPPPAAAAAAGSALDRQRKGFAALSLLDPEHATGYNTAFGLMNPELTTLPDGIVVNMRDPALLGSNHAALDPGMVRGPDGSVTNAQGYTQALAERELAKGGAQAANELQTVNIGGKEYQIPRLQAGTVVGIGPNGQPTLSMGGITAPSKEDPADVKLRESDVANFAAAKNDAQTKAAAATEQLNQLDDMDRLIHGIKPGFGAQAKFQVGRALQSAGLIQSDGSPDDVISKMAQFQKGQTALVLGSLRTNFGAGRITNADLKAAMATAGDLEDPEKAVLYMNDLKRVQAQRLQQRADFMQDYQEKNGSKVGSYEKAWQNSDNGQKSLYDYPTMWKHLDVVQGRPGTPAEGKQYVQTPSGRIYEVKLNQYGEPVPVQGQ